MLTICQKCNIPSSFPGIDFQDGVCTFCRNHREEPHKTVAGESRLKEILTSGESKKYHCVVPVSGGKDRCYVLLHVANRLRLNPLAVLFDSGFQSQTAKINVERVCSALGVDLERGNATRFRRKIIKEALIIAHLRGKIERICENCEQNLRAFALDVAIRHKIPFIVWGATSFEERPEVFLDPNAMRQEAFGSKSSSALMPNLKQLPRQILHQTRIRGNWFSKGRLTFHIALLRYYCWRDNLEMISFDRFSKLNPFYQVSWDRNDVKLVHFFDYVRYDPFRQLETLQGIGWTAPKNRELKLDCLLYSLKNLQHMKESGITLDGFHLSVLVRNGLLEREAAISKEAAIQADLEKDTQDVCREFQVNLSFLDRKAASMSEGY